MADDPDFSKPVDVKKPRPLDQLRNDAALSVRHLQAQQDARQSTSQKGQGSAQVKASAPGMHLRPDGAARSGPDAEAHLSNLRKDRIAEALKSRPQKEQEKEKDGGKER